MQLHIRILCREAVQNSMVDLGLTLLAGTVSVAIATLLGDKLLHTFHKSWWWMTESGMAILVGMFGGLVWYLGTRSSTDEAGALELLAFQPHVFTLLLLPPIIFDSGYSLNHSSFFSNFGAILVFAFAGTLVAFAVTAPVLYYGLGGDHGLLTPMEAAAFSALISAVDPVATLTVFSSTGADPKLNSLIFGESVLNDAVAIVLFKTVVQLGLSTRIGTDGFAAISAGDVFKAVGSFCFIFAGSLAIGVLGGGTIALTFKLAGLRELPAHHAAPAELVLLIALSYATFLLAEYAHLSGIVAALFGGAVAVIYVKPNLTERGAKLCKTVVSALAKFSETIVFLLIGYGFWLYVLGDSAATSVSRGNATATPCLPPELHEGQVSLPFVALTLAMCLIARFCSTFPMAALINCFRAPQNRIGANEQAVIWFSGLRGAIALALAVEFPLADEVSAEAVGSFCYQRDHVVSCTIVVVLCTVFGMGGFTKPVLRLAGIKMGLAKVKAPPKTSHKSRLKRHIRWLDQHVIRPILVADYEPLAQLMPPAPASVSARPGEGAGGYAADATRPGDIELRVTPSAPGASPVSPESHVNIAAM